jgi:hypothetical protein
MGRLARLGVILAALVVGCGGSSQFQNLTTPYVGTWMIASGEDTDQCAPIPGAPTMVSGSVIVDYGAEPLILSTRDTNHGTCVWQLAVSQVSATLRAGPSCTATTTTSNATVAPVDYTLTVTGSNTAMVASTFDWTILGATCRHTQTESLVLMQMR